MVISFTFINEYVYYAHRQNNNKIKQRKGKIEQTLQNTKLYQKIIHTSKMSYIILLTVENRVFLDHLLKIQNCINSFENIKVLNTSLTTEFLQSCMLR